MEISNVGYTPVTSAAAATTDSTAASSTAAASTTTAAPTEPKDVYEPSNKTAQKPTVNATDIRRMMDETNRQTESMREMIKKLISKQAEKDTFGKNPVFNANGERMIEIDDETRRKAQADIAEGGYYSVENTGDRILSFADAIAGNDPAKIETMRKAVQDGFKAAEKQWGGSLPQISQDTYDYIMKGFDERVAKATGAANA